VDPMSAYEGVDMTRVMYGENARHAPAWMYVRDGGQGIVSFVGSSRVRGDNPLTYGSGHWSRQREGDPSYFPLRFMVGEIIVRPHILIGTRSTEYTGMGLGGLATCDHDMNEMLAHGRLILGSAETAARIRKQWESS